MVTTTRKRRQRGSGALRQLSSGRWQARFHGNDGVMYPAPTTFDTKIDAAAWLRGQADDLERGMWSPPVAAPRATSLKAYADTWLAARNLKPRTRSLYRGLLDDLILPDLGPAALDRITAATVRGWYGKLNAATPTRRAHAYSLLKSIYTTAVADELAPANPCRIRGAGAAKTAHKTRVATLAELEVIVENIAARYRAMVLLAAWCGLRFGELAELRRSDVEWRRDDDGAIVGGVLHVERAVTRSDGEVHIGDPKSEAGRRIVAIPPHLLPVLETHLEKHVGADRDALLFPARSGGHLAPASLYRVWYPAREAAGRDDLRFHDLRHTGATLAAATGATLADLMSRLGHSTPAAALRYQHAAADRDQAIAEALSGFATAGKVSLGA